MQQQQQQQRRASFRSVEPLQPPGSALFFYIY
jgi:hypothetical protein